MEDLVRSGKQLGKRGLIERTEFVRVIIQCLYSLGYKKSAAALELESGVPLDSQLFGSLLPLIVSGRWEECEETIAKFEVLPDEIRSSVSFLIWRESFMELQNSSCSDGQLLLPGLSVLRERICPLDVDRKKVHELARYLVSVREEMPEDSSIARRRVELLADLSELLPPWIRLSEQRLQRLVEMSLIEQRISCIYHNSTEPISLYEDHKCSSDQIPSRTGQILTEHKNEVWFVQFSNNGEFLASASKDCTAIIWAVGEDDRVLLKHILNGHTKPVSFATWSPDDSMLITCGNEETLKLWAVETGTCRWTLNDSSVHVISSCAWFPNSQKIVCASSEPENCIFMCDVQGKEIETWKGERLPKISNLSVTPDGRRLICSSDNRIRIYDLDGGDVTSISLEHTISSLSISRDGMRMIANVNSVIYLWRIGDGSTAAAQAKYSGHAQVKYLIRSCFGGAASAFIASGSEDAKVYIWHRERCMLVKVLTGHEMTVNGVSWNPTRPHMLVSASDDHTVRVWLTGSPILNEKISV